MGKILTGYGSLEEVPQEERSFVVEEEGKLFYVNDGLLTTLKNQRESENRTKAELEKAMQELEGYKNQKKDDEQEQKKPEKQEDNQLVLGLQKQIEALTNTVQKSEQEKKELKINQLKMSAAKNANIDEMLLPVFDNQIDHDDQGLFIKDFDGSPKLNQYGQRLTIEDFYKQKVKENPKFAKESASGSGFQSNGLRGNINQNQATASRIKEAKSEYTRAIQEGNVYLIERLEREANEYGFKL